MTFCGKKEDKKIKNKVDLKKTKLVSKVEIIMEKTIMQPLASMPCFLFC